jgi:hypothetical protein
MATPFTQTVQTLLDHPKWPPNLKRGTSLHSVSRPCCVCVLPFEIIFWTVCLSSLCSAALFDQLLAKQTPTADNARSWVSSGAQWLLSDDELPRHVGGALIQRVCQYQGQVALDFFNPGLLTGMVPADMHSPLAVKSLALLHRVLVALHSISSDSIALELMTRTFKIQTAFNRSSIAEPVMPVALPPVPVQLALLKLWRDVPFCMPTAPTFRCDMLVRWLAAFPSFDTFPAEWAPLYVDAIAMGWSNGIPDQPMLHSMRQTLANLFTLLAGAPLLAKSGLPDKSMPLTHGSALFYLTEQCPPFMLDEVKDFCVDCVVRRIKEEHSLAALQRALFFSYFSFYFFSFAYLACEILCHRFS